MIIDQTKGNVVWHFDMLAVRRVLENSSINALRSMQNRSTLLFLFIFFSVLKEQGQYLIRYEVGKSNIGL